MAEKPKVVIVCGPTGAGKTSVSMKWAEAVGGEIIGADSMQIYRYMDIGTAKPTDRERARVPHHLVDFIDPDAPFDAAVYGRMAREKIFELNEKNIQPFVVGGTGLYIRALERGMFQAPPINGELRQQLRDRARELGPEKMHDELKQVDPETAKKVHPNDRFRILRALEVYYTAKVPISELRRLHAFSTPCPFSILKIGLGLNRQTLYKRIDLRVDEMIARGLVQEVKSLLDRGYGPDLKSMQSIGYRHITDFLEKRLDWDEAVRTLKRDTRRFAKRQFTWFEKDPDIIWAAPDQYEAIKRKILRFLGLSETDDSDRITGMDLK